MKLPRDWSGIDLANRLATYGYQIRRQRGSHIRLTTQSRGEHHISIPAKKSLKTGTLASILDAVAVHFDLSCDEVLDSLR